MRLYKKGDLVEVLTTKYGLWLEKGDVVTVFKDQANPGAHVYFEAGRSVYNDRVKLHIRDEKHFHESITI